MITVTVCHPTYYSACRLIYYVLYAAVFYILMDTNQVTAVVIGAGSRGSSYANYALDFPEKFKVISYLVLERCSLHHLYQVAISPDETSIQRKVRNLCGSQKLSKH